MGRGKHDPVPKPVRTFQIEFSGFVTGVEADSPEQAWEKAKEYLALYAHSHTVKEIGVDVTEVGWPIPNVPKPVAPLHTSRPADVRGVSITDPWEV